MEVAKASAYLYLSFLAKYSISSTFSNWLSWSKYYSDIQA